MNPKPVQIGYWIERASREVTQCPTSYGGDWERLQTVAGRYPLRLVCVRNQPSVLLTDIAADRTGGHIFPGFATVRWRFQRLPKGPTTLNLRLDAAGLKALVAAGCAEVEPAYQWLMA